MYSVTNIEWDIRDDCTVWSLYNLFIFFYNYDLVFFLISYAFVKSFNHIQAIVCFTQNSLGWVGPGDSTFFFLLWCVIQIYNTWSNFGKPLGLNLIICKKIYKPNIYCNIKLLNKKMCKTKSAINMINYNFFCKFKCKKKYL